MADPRRHLLADDAEIAFEDGDTVLEALLRAGLHPTGGGCLCAAGDCPHCLATVDGVGYVRTCQVRATEGLEVVREHRGGGYPRLDLDTPALTPESVGGPVRYLRCDVVVIGEGSSGLAAAEAARGAGSSVLSFDAARGDEVVGIYPGPLVIVRGEAETIHVEPRQEIVVATGAAELQPVAPGSELDGIVTARAAERFAAAGVDLGRVAAVGVSPSGIEAVRVTGELVRIEGERRVEAVVVATAGGEEERVACDTLSVGLGLQPRDVLARMARGLGGEVAVRVVGDAARSSDVPPCPASGIVCPCSQVSVADLDEVWGRGFREMELVKRATLAGTGTCQGSACIPYLRSFIADRGTQLQPPFTARPVARQRTLGELAAGAYFHATPRTALHDEHLAAGAVMERSGGWFRPWSYGDVEAEYRAVRESVSIGDVSTLGKILVSGPDALELLERLYPTRVSTLRPGRCRYALLLDERGTVLDDGMICREECAPGESRYRLSFTSGGSTLAELWLRDWAESWQLDVRILNQTTSLGAINVTGPRAAELLHRAGARWLPGFGAHGRAQVAGVACHILRLSFTGELSYELHHPAADSVDLWRRLLAAGDELGCRPHGLDALLRLRLEKGHILVGQDTDYDSTPRRIGHEWAVDGGKEDFVGKPALARTDPIPLDRRLVGLEMDGPAPIEGAVVWNDGDYAGYLTSSADSPVLGRAVMLGWVATIDDQGRLPETVTVDGRAARVTSPPFYDPGGERARSEVALGSAPGIPQSDDASRGSDEAGVLPSGSAATPIAATHPSQIDERSFRRVALARVAARPAAMDAYLSTRAAGSVALRVAPDEAMLFGTVDSSELADPHAIVELETGFAAAWMPAAEAAEILEATCEWEIPPQRPAFAQGAVADLPVKLWLEEGRTLFVVPEPYAGELQHRLERSARPRADRGEAP